MAYIQVDNPNFNDIIPSNPIITKKKKVSKLGKSCNFVGTVYVLELENDCFYIGWTTNFPRRMHKHFNKPDVYWLFQNRPINILEKHENKHIIFEDIKTKEYINKYGVSYVRGGNFCGKEDEEILEILKKENELIEFNLNDKRPIDVDIGI